MNYTARDPEGQARLAAVVATLAERRWIDGKNLKLDIRWAEGSHKLAEEYAVELAGLPLAAILTNSTPLTDALKKATQTIPVVFTQVSEPVGSGLVASLAQPGGNLTGFTDFEAGTAGKWVELLREASPALTRIVVLQHPTMANQAAFVQAIEAAARSLHLQTMVAGVLDRGEIERALSGQGGQPGSGLVVVPNPVNNNARQTIITLAASGRLPAIYPFRYYAADGGLMAYSVDQIAQWRSAALYVDRILRGEKPADLPVQAPTRYSLTINLRTARALHLTLPPAVLAKADELIE